MMNATDNTIISIILGTVVVGYYSNYCLIVNQITNLVNAGMYASTPSVGNLMALENEEKKIEIYKKIQFISNFICLILIPCFFFLINDFINVWLGKGFLLDTISVIAISVNFYLSIALLPIWIFREAAGLYKEVKYVILVAAILNIGLSVLLGLFLGLAGILFASAISRLLTYFWYEPIILFKKYFKERPIYYFVGLLKSMIPMLFIFVPCFFIDKHFSSNTILLFLAKALVILVISLAISVLFFCRNKEFKYFVSLYFRKIAKKKER